MSREIHPRGRKATMRASFCACLTGSSRRPVLNDGSNPVKSRHRRHRCRRCGYRRRARARSAGEVPFVIIEAKDRIGGRAYSETTSLGHLWDHGCHWFHSADKNILRMIAEGMGHKFCEASGDRDAQHFHGWQLDIDGRCARTMSGGCSAKSPMPARRGKDIAASDAARSRAIPGIR